MEGKKKQEKKATSAEEKPSQDSHEVAPAEREHKRPTVVALDVLPTRPASKRKRRKEEALEAEVIRVQREIHRLESKRDCMLDFPMQPTILNDRQTTKLMHDYCKMFEYGFNVKNASQGWKQEQFLRSIMRDDLRITGVTFTSQGIDKIIGAHRMYAMAHIDYHMRFLECSNIVDDTGAVVMCELRSIATQRITRQVLQMYYPMALQYEVLVQLLIGELIDLAVTQIFEFDNLGRIEGYVPRIEVMEAFAALLANNDLKMLCAMEHKLRVLFQ
ncbi:hypothetical protein AC1031_000159 [Aphanomyces cochlioides]|nr:hypothetical protein AC1031_000159 [Aphanomyces cochlioides]